MSEQKTIQTDLFVIGGGINGTGVALDATLRGLDVVLCEAEDLASATSSASSKLVHGGLRYLEQYEFKLVKEALKEREVLLKKAPHLIQPLRFILPHAKHLRPVWMIKAGLFLYDFLAGKMSLDKSKKVALKGTKEGQGLIDDFSVGFSYSDCRIDDARMVVANAKQAQENGAKVLLPYRCIEAKKIDGLWRAKLINKENETIIVEAKAIVNAAGPWVAQLIHEVLDTPSKSSVRLIKGSHIVVPKMYEGDHAYILQNKDGRIVFALPYGFVSKTENQFTLIGTTDVNYQGDPRDVHISDKEKHYLCDLINGYFKQKISLQDIIWEYAGVRPLYDDKAKKASEITREYHLELEDEHGKLPVLSIFGGKITTFRTLSKKVVDQLKPYFPEMRPCVTDTVPTLGGDMESLDQLLIALNRRYQWLDTKLAYRLATAYGTKVFNILEDAKSTADLGQCFGHYFYEAEAKYLINEEWCHSLESMIWRRSKLGLWLNPSQKQALEDWLKQQLN
ncbi:glycerol-3-phosphate dehydrogenase [Facilibium subflavum]|uniref:glycerol-3-phosphate dehydrogenase n=1 Tax=Facilibium subflavum TaxID=2219058 RepID=UPI000E65B7A8|nr:glycerol-3-phosphate dehydrogenase [Facilibium subflavum]